MKKIIVSIMMMGLPVVVLAQDKGKGLVRPIPGNPKSEIPQKQLPSKELPRTGDHSNGVRVDPPKSFSHNSWRVEIGIGDNGDDQFSRWDDRLEYKVRRLERKIERMEEVIDYLLYVVENNRGGGRRDDYLYRCSMSVCLETNSFFCDSHDYRTEVAIGTDRVRLFEELKRRGSSYYSDSFRCSDM